MNTPLIEFRDITNRFGNRTILDHVNLQIFEDQVTTIIGKSGEGKSVLLKHIIGLLQPDEGHVLYRGKALDNMSKKEWYDYIGQISYMFQNNALFDSLTVFDKVALPLSVFHEIARILKPQGYFIITFSNRWFPTKAIKIWRDIHEFERMGLVLEYFIRSESFSELKTYSIRGLSRPRDDKYFPDLRFSDPVYAVWGRKH